jgi:outer membrane protein assembly factor BamB
LIVSNSGEAILLRGRTAVPVWSSRVDAYQVSSGQVLRRGQSRRSANGRYIFAMQWDGNAVLYDDQAKQALWAWEWPGRGGSLAMQADGNLVLHSAAGGALTATMTDGNRGARLVVQDDGNAVLYSSVRRPMWCAQLDRQQISAGQTLHPGQSRTSANRRFKLGMQWDGNLVLIDTTTGAVLWASQTGGNPRAVAMLQLDGNFVVLSEGGKALFATHTEGTRAAKMFVQDDGNLVLSTEAGQQVWSKTGRHY